jgi:hypothetical protein
VGSEIKGYILTGDEKASPDEICGDYVAARSVQMKALTRHGIDFDESAFKGAFVLRGELP